MCWHKGTRHQGYPFLGRFLGACRTVPQCVDHQLLTNLPTAAARTLVLVTVGLNGFCSGIRNQKTSSLGMCHQHPVVSSGSHEDHAHQLQRTAQEYNHRRCMPQYHPYILAGE